MNPENSRSVYRYFEPADAFVQIRVCEATALCVDPSGMTRANYRRSVLEACIPDYARDLARRVGEIAPEDPLLLEDLLYQLCVEVNPGLDIHTVRLGGDAAQRSGAAPKVERARRDQDFLQSLRRRARGLPRRLENRIIGQPRAVETVARAVEKAAVGLAVPGRPFGAFLFVGRTGTGKTELARTLAQELFGARDARGRGLIRIDCAEYALAHEYSKLIGAPPGYVGHEDGGQLTEAILKNPETVVLFDEIEKANPRLHNLMLSILEEGSLTDGKGRRVSFERTLVLMTSNAGAAEMLAAQRTVGFERSNALAGRQLEEITTDALRRQFSPEFLGRLDEIVVFEELDLAAARLIAQRQLSDLARRARTAGLRVAFSPSVARWVAERGFSPDYGARELRRVVQREIESPLSQLVLERADRPRGLIRVRIQGGEPRMRVES